MRYMQLVRNLTLGVAAVSVVACGGGGGGGGGTIGPAGVSLGTITGFGSVFVNGVRFNTDNATLFRGDDQLNDIRALSIGMKVRVNGNIDTRVASSVRFDEDVKGPADGAAAGNILSVMGQRIITDTATIFNNTSLAAIGNGDILEISGLRNSDDDIVARFVEKKNNPANVNRYSLIGNVRNLDTVAKTFLIDGLTVDYSSANINDLPSGNPADGQLVEVKDANKAYVPGSLILAATKVEPQNQLGNAGVAGAKVEIESIVTKVNSSNEFEIGGLVVRTSPSTRFLFGTSGNIIPGVRLEVEGLIDGNNVLQASKVKFEDNDTRIAARVDAGGVDPGTGTVTLLGIPVNITSGTVLEDKRDDSVPFSLNEISDSDYLEIRGFLGANGAFVATELTRENNDSKVEVRGPVSSKDSVAGTVTILGVTVNTNSSTQFEDLNDQLVAASQFFDAITVGLTLVKVKWDPFADTSTPAKEVELED